jgi:hypothetical protein
LQDLSRITVDGITFAPGTGLFCNNPESILSLNTWRPAARNAPADWPERVLPFLEHVAYLVPEDDERSHFLDWLAHIAQRPGVLPHHHWLMVARNFGLGRNWLAGALARVFAGHVALDFDLVHALDSGFNGRLSEKLLAIVDEIDEGSGEGRWRHSNMLRTMLTAETRLVNPKYGRQKVEFNCCRFLIFSNHETALPLTEDDRRINVVTNPAEPRDPDYYKRLYALLADRDFIHAVHEFLMDRDISDYNPGAHARLNDAKQQIVMATQSDATHAARTVVRLYPSDIAASSDLQLLIFDHIPENPADLAKQANALKYALLDAGAGKYPRRVRVDGPQERVWILRNRTVWLRADPWKVSQEVTRGRALAKGMVFED